VKLSNLIDKIEEIAPLKLTESWDNCGLIVGDNECVVSGLLLAMDVTEDVLDYAISNNINTILAHHPMIFKSMKKFDSARKRSFLLKKAMINDLNILAWHTPLDLCDYGTHYALGKIIGLENESIIEPITSESFYKIISFIPKDHVELVAKALTDAGAGRYGDYDSCTFRQSGTGTFRPVDGANPYIGELGKLEFVDEIKLEAIVKETDLKNVVAALKLKHPYEEVAYDVIEVKNLKKVYGHGRAGKIEKTTLITLAERLKKDLKCKSVTYYGDENLGIENVAFCPGGGEDLISKVRNVDVYISSDLRSTKVLDLIDKNIAVIDLGHYYSERPVLDELEKLLNDKIDDFEIKIAPFELDNGSLAKKL
jgi:dinuclear metal center YbgI/SA1388 family protein